MEKRYFWAIQEVDEKTLLWRFRSGAEREQWSKESFEQGNYYIAVTGNNPEVRRIQRRINQGEVIIFPVEV